MMGRTAKARIAYVGDALNNGEMEVRELAPALMAFADLVESAHYALGGTDPIRILLNQDSLRKGSFDVTMILDMGILEQAKLFAGMARDSGLADLMEVLGWGKEAAEIGSVVGIFALVKKVRGRKMSDIQEKEEKVEIRLEDGAIVCTNAKTMKIFLDAKCRMSVEKVVQPLKMDGIEQFELRNPDTPDSKFPIEKIEKNDVAFFKAPPAASIQDIQLESPADMELTVEITSVNFKKGHKWLLSDGNSTFWASIQDEDFAKRVEEGQISFACGDMMKIRYHVQQNIKNGKLSSEYVITEVLDIIRKPTQIQIDFHYEQ